MKLTRRKRIIIASSTYVLLAAWLLFTNPQDLPIVLLMVPFVLLVVALWTTVGLLLDKFFPKLKRSRRFVVTASVSGVPVFLLILGSINQLTWRDVLLVVILIVALYFYSGRLNFSSRS